VEVADLSGGVMAVRDSKDPDSGSATGPSGSYDISVLYSWVTSDSQIILPKALLDPDAPDAPDASDSLVTGLRVGCGTGFTAGDNEGEYRADGACSDMETPRLTGGVSLAVLGTVATGRRGARPPHGTAVRTAT
jgi:hypothetical protein